MSLSSLPRLRPVLHLAQSLAHGVLILLTLAALAATLLAALGQLPWLHLPLRYGETDLPQSGRWAQIALTALLCLICLFLPANSRMARLERSHRSFAMGLEDVAHAYRLAHAADRAGVFALSGEFDSMRARLAHLRDHPDLGHLEPELLQLAAQMSFQTRDLARTYSDDRVARARSFLQQRQEEVAALTDRLTLARQTVDELRRWLTDIEVEERQAEAQIKRLEADLREILPQIGYAMEAEENRDTTVVQLPKPGK
ncbi:DNA repair protein [Tabrizicola sp. TH137]|uniref:DNA repair protein n=1 Tax=Tabrizicola sp. TH137 TaxID=2067452 RepID=UPI000C7CCE13|nr:DNA repair protein [Tabrizicola sp. TH137]PLL13567.1 DNA repair protein [Tabrizicola sp. TH137]